MPPTKGLFGGRSRNPANPLMALLGVSQKPINPLMALLGGSRKPINPLMALLGGSRKPTNPLLALLGGPQRQSSGLLSTILGGNSQAASGLFTGARQTSGLGNISEMVNNTQRVISAAQKAMPMMQQVKQYGPLIKNMPAMYKMIKAINAAEILSNVEEADEATDQTEIDQPTTLHSTPQRKKQPIVEKKSLPKIFVP